ncbi:MAG: ribonuclease J [Pseudomonadota bacterium]
MAEDELVFLPLGGSGEIGMNMNLYGFGPAHRREWIMIDCGVTFGDLSTPGVELICPDPSYILEDVDRLQGLLLTHGHEDHIGAVGFLASKFDCPIFATPFTAALVQHKLDEYNANHLDLNVIDMDARFSLGPFDLEYVTLTHSIPEPNGVILRTPLGHVLHTGDWKIDRAPTLGPKTDAKKIQTLGDAGLMAMVCDSTNVLSEGESGSESDVRDTLISMIGKLEGRVVVTTFASNVSRVLSICEAAAASDRTVCLLGRSMLRIVEIARETGLLPEALSFASPSDAAHLPRRHVLYLCTGSQGEPRAALARIARGDHRDIALAEGDTVIFSSKVIPGNEREIFDLQNDLVDLGVEIITEKDAFIHVSGHPCREELKMMYEWARPEIAIPVHGEARHLEAHADLAETLGVAEALAPRNGDLIRLAPEGPSVIEEVPSGRLYLDGAVLTAAGAAPMRERRKLGYAGVVAVSVNLDPRGDEPVRIAIAGKGVVFGNSADTQRLQEEIQDAVLQLKPAKRDDDDAVETVVTRAVRRHFDPTWSKRPVVLSLIHRADL